MPEADPFQLSRFVHAQDPVYADVLDELRQGRKQTHWMWFIFPQFKGIGHSATAKSFAINSLDEARAYLRHPVLGPRLIECARLVASISNRTVSSIFGYPDDLKFRSSITLFARVSDDPLFEQLLARHFDGQPDPKTIAILNDDGRLSAGG